MQHWIKNTFVGELSSTKSGKTNVTGLTGDEALPFSKTNADSDSFQKSDDHYSTKRSNMAPLKPDLKREIRNDVSQKQNPNETKTAYDTFWRPSERKESGGEEKHWIRSRRSRFFEKGEKEHNTENGDSALLRRHMEPGTARTVYKRQGISEETREKLYEYLMARTSTTTTTESA